MTAERFGLAGRLHAAIDAFRAPERLRRAPCDEEAALAMLVPAAASPGPKTPNVPTDLLSLSLLPFDR